MVVTDDFIDPKHLSNSDSDSKHSSTSMTHRNMNTAYSINTSFCF